MATFHDLVSFARQEKIRRPDLHLNKCCGIFATLIPSAIYQLLLSGIYCVHGFPHNDGFDFAAARENDKL